MTLNLREHLTVGTPLVWVSTDEPRRVIEELTEVSPKVVHRLDVMDGLVSWSKEALSWKKVLMPDEEGNLAPVTRLADALQCVTENRELMVIEHAHLMADQIMPFLDHIARTYVDAFNRDDLDHMPASFVLCSCKDEVPPELTRALVRHTFSLPDEEDLHSILTHIADRLHTPAEEFHHEVRAGLGMSEFEFSQACALSLQQFGTVDAEFINKTKLDNLKRDGVLTLRSPTTTLADIGGLDNAKDLIERICWLWNHPAEAAKFELEPLRRLLLVGVSGSGKSYLCEATANSLGLDLAQFGVSRMMSKWVGESESNMRKAFAQVAAMKPLVLWIDEFGRDLSGGSSSAEVDGGTTDRVHGEFLQGLQELPNEVFLVCAANNIAGLPPEMLRADRFDKVMFVGFPTQAERAEIFQLYLGAATDRYDIDALAQATPQFTGAEIKALIREVRFDVVGGEQRHPDTDDFVARAPTMKGRVWVNHHDLVVAMYQRALKEWDFASSGQEAEAQTIAAGSTKSPQRAAKKPAVPLDEMFNQALGQK